MKPYYLKFSDEAEANSVLYVSVEVPGKKTVEYTDYLIQGEPDEDGDVENYITSEVPDGAVVLDSWPETYEQDDLENLVPHLKPIYANMDIIGTIYKYTGKVLMNEEGEYQEVAALEGWHVNVLVVDEDASALEPYAVTPAVPVRVWG